MGLRSGLLDGHGNTLVLLSVRKSLLTWDVWVEHRHVATQIYAHSMAGRKNNKLQQFVSVMDTSHP
jgi:hypothetical protein